MSYEEFNKIFSKNLRFYLNEYDMTQAELAKRLNVGTTSVYNWCNGIKTPRMDKIDAMCGIFNCKRSDLMEDKEPLMCNYGIHTNESIGTKMKPAHEIIKEARIKNGISQKKLAEEVGMTQQAIALIENGKRKVEYDLFVRIMDYLQEPLYENESYYTNPETAKIAQEIYYTNLTPEEELQTVLGNLLISEYIKCTDHIKELKAAGETESVNYYSRRSGEIARIYQQLIFL